MAGDSTVAVPWDTKPPAEASKPRNGDAYIKVAADEKHISTLATSGDPTDEPATLAVAESMR